ncbi:MAG TPA: DUF11 domain-containing protein [Vicinamibacteria bacterium]|nr:DUF11 domain-containing protein [Vicinamibacteria bacterium]
MLLTASAAGAQPYDASWWTVDGGGGTAAGGSFVLAGTVGQPDAGGPFAAAPFQLRSGFWALAGGGTTGAEADLAVAQSDDPDPVAAGATVVYTIAATNLGPAPSPSTTVTDTLPAAVAFLSASAGCAHAAGVVTCALGTLASGATATVTVEVAVAPGFGGVVTNAASVAGGAPDPATANNTDSETTTVVLRAEGELAHGTRLRADLAAVGGLPDVDLYRMRQEPFASYEVVLDEAAGDVGAGSGPALDRVAADGSTVLQAAGPVGSGPVRSLRVVNATSSTIDEERIRVRSASCTSSCGIDDTYRLRAWETTASVPRFNNSGTQVTVLLLQNPLDVPVAGTVYFWSAGGALASQQPFSLDPRALLVLNTATLLPGAGGSITIVHDGPYGALAGKTVALEPAIGYSFDSPLVFRAR